MSTAAKPRASFAALKLVSVLPLPVVCQIYSSIPVPLRAFKSSQETFFPLLATAPLF